MVSVYTYFNFRARNGVHLYIFQFWGLEMGSIYTYFKFGGRNGVHLHIFQRWGRKWCPFTHISNLGPGVG